jgi:type II restriction/modification system DNA methylase subunit YeeA
MHKHVVHHCKNKLMDKQKLLDFIEYSKLLEKDEKGEAQVFCDRLFQAFGHKGYKEAGAVLETRVKTKKSTKFADLVWGDRVVIEMKKGGEKLEKHKTQLFEYWWNLRPNQPQYSILCNFDKFYIYDFSIQDEPLDKIDIENLEKRISAFNFLYPKPKKAIFENNLEVATRETADKVAKVFNSLIQRKIEREHAQKFILQCVFTMFSEDYELLPDGFFTGLLQECLYDEENSYHLIDGLFKQMANPKKAPGGRYKQVRYFNGGLFKETSPIELNRTEIFYLLEAAKKDWSKVSPIIFGTIFQGSMDAEEQHAYGAHFTNELDIYKIIYPSIIQVWKTKIKKADTFISLQDLLIEIRQLQILDPGCGSGNFLYVAYRELKRLELDIINKIHSNFPSKAKIVGSSSLVNVKQFHGMDINEFAVDLAKITLLFAKEISIRETRKWLETGQMGLNFELEYALPLDNLDTNFLCGDALFTEWVDADIIVGNPPFLGGKYLREKRGDEYAEKVYARFPEAKGQVDYCTHWFRLAHDNKAQHCGLVATNSIAQGVSRAASLDYIVKNGGYITNAVSSQKWSGEANVSVSIVNWVKNKKNIPKKLQLDAIEVDTINSSLKTGIDVIKTKKLSENSKKSFESCQLAGKGFVITAEIANSWMKQDSKNKNVLKPMLDGTALVNPNYKLDWVIDFNDMQLEEASKYVLPFEHVKENVKPERLTNKEKIRREKWWQFGRRRPQMRKELENLESYFCLSKVAKYTCFQAINAEILPCEANMVITSDDFFILGVLNSSVHMNWVIAQRSTHETRTRYTNTTCFETFPFPDDAKEKLKEKVREVMRELESFRKKECKERNITITTFYNLFINEPASQLYKLHEKLDKAVVTCYGWKYITGKNHNPELLELNINRSK